LQLLELNAGDCDTLLVCALLRSPWLLGSTSEADARARLEARLRRRGELRTTLSALRTDSLQTDQPWSSPLLGTGLLEFEKLRLRQPQRQLLADWLDVFRRQWDCLLDAGQLSPGTQAGSLQAWQLWLDGATRSAFLQGNCSRA